MVKEVLRREDLLEHLEQESPTGKTETTATWKKKDLHTRWHFVINLGEEEITNVTSIIAEEASAKELWDKLKSIYQKDNLQAVNNWQSELYKYYHEVKILIKTFKDLRVNSSNLHGLDRL